MRSLLLLSALAGLAAPGAALAQRTATDTEVICRFDVMTNARLCLVKPKWSNSATAMAENVPLTFDQELKVRARESAERYARKGQCDKARKRAVESTDQDVVDAVERRCGTVVPGAVSPG